MTKWISIGPPELKGNRIENVITASVDMTKYLKYSIFYVEYDEEIEWNPSILNIPAVTSLITFAWLAGAELRVGELDLSFASSMRDLHREYNTMYLGVLGGRLRVERAWLNKGACEGLALFFSGGLDSTYSLYELMDESPRLIMVKGYDYYMDRPEDEETWGRWKETYGEFAEKKGLTLNFVETNSRACLSEAAINTGFGRLSELSFWESLRHAPLLIGLGAPLSQGRFNRLVISASRTSDSPTTMDPYSSAPNTDEKIAWAGTEITHFGMIYRHEKVNALLKPLSAGEINMRSCYRSDLTGWNCSECEKCARVLSFILSAGIDPNGCGFVVTDETFGLIKRRIKKNRGWKLRAKLHWVPWINSLPEEIPNTYGLREFVDWIRRIGFEHTDVEEPGSRRLCDQHRDPGIL